MVKYKIIIIFICFFYNILSAQSPDSLLKKVNEQHYLIDKINIFTNKNEISFPAEFNMQNGLVELVLCGKRGKLHESILKTNIVPSHLQTALLMLGLECGHNLDFQGQDKIPEGDSLKIYAEWSDSLNNTKNVRIEELVYNKAKKRKMMKTHWIFLGSKFIDGRFMGDVEESIITTYHDPFSIIDNPLETGNDDTLYEVNNNLVPKKGTKAKIIIRKYKI